MMNLNQQNLLGRYDYNYTYYNNLALDSPNDIYFGRRDKSFKKLSIIYCQSNLSRLRL